MTSWNDDEINKRAGIHPIGPWWLGCFPTLTILAILAILYSLMR